MHNHYHYRTVVLSLVAITSLCNLAAAGDYAELIRSTRGLLAYYRFEESDESVGDSSPGGHAAELEGEALRGVDSAHDALGRALRLTGDGYLRVPELGDVSAVTFEMWMNLTSAPTESITALYASNGWKPQFFHMNMRRGGKLELAVNGNSNYATSEPSLFTPGQWSHLVATYDRETGEQFLYVDGRVVNESVANPKPGIRLAAGAVGAWVNGTATRELIADIDEVAIYSVALPAAQVRAHYLAGKGKAPQPVDFARQVRPLLEKRCFECHGPETHESELRLDVRDSAMRGGESGEPAIMPFDADNSHLIKLVTSKIDEARMPPEGPALTAAEVTVLKNWIDLGATWPDALAGHAEPERVETSHWSFQPVKKPKPPKSDDPFVTTGNEIDAFIFDKLREKQLKPSPQADARTLVRRLHLDVHGLPPTPERIERFAKKPSPKAWKQMVDEALASPRYGERWASHWLDVIRYGDTHGFEVNTPRPNAWPYRDYVIRSLNADLPYDQFIREQLAGDQQGVDAATGFLVAAPALLRGQIGKDEASKRQARADELHEIIVSVGSGVMGLTIGCARCHNHKFDPISQRDYYQLQAIFAGVQYGERPMREGVELPTGAEQNKDAARVVFAGKFAAAEPSFRLYRGDAMQRRERVSPDVPAVFGTLRLESTTDEAARRKALADWLVSPADPLTARVIVNRIWQHHFGTGLVATPSDFGAMGVPPSHPELLDWLAATLVERGWSLKELHRLILTSNTYRQSSAPRREALAIDASSQMLWRFPPRRLEMEAIRDSVLATSGVLDLTMGGPGFMVFKPNSNYVRVYDARDEWGPDAWRRMVYAHRARMAQDGVFGAFDCPDAGQPQPVRSRSTTGIQALNLYNSSFMHQQSKLLAERVEREAGSDRAAQIARVFALAYGREPSDDELAAASELADEFGTAAVCRAVFNSNEFLFLP
jgi:hypothetical protein